MPFPLPECKKKIEQKIAHFNQNFKKISGEGQHRAKTPPQ